MKKLFLFLAFLFALTVETYAQAEYKSLESFNNDTLKYIRYNFEENKQRYIGQAYNKFIKEFELTPYYDKTFTWREPDISKIWGGKNCILSGYAICRSQKQEAFRLFPIYRCRI